MASVTSNGGGRSGANPWLRSRNVAAAPSSSGASKSGASKPGASKRAGSRAHVWAPTLLKAERRAAHVLALIAERRRGQMRGMVTTRALLINGVTIVREFGLRCYVRCWRRVLTNRRVCTFLECI